MSTALPDGCTPDMLPGNSIVAERMDYQIEQSMSVIHEAAEEELRRKVLHNYSRARTDFVDWLKDAHDALFRPVHLTTHVDRWIADVRATEADVWRDQVAISTAEIMEDWK